MGSSNISDSGLGIKQPPQYELNVAMKDYDDVKYCADEFWTLWEAAIPLTADDIAEYKAAMINPANGKFMASGAKIAWIVNGTQVGVTELYAHDDTLFD